MKYRAFPRFIVKDKNTKPHVLAGDLYETAVEFIKFMEVSRFLKSNPDYGYLASFDNFYYCAKNNDTGEPLSELAFDFDNGVVWTREPKFRDYSCEIEFMYKNDIYVAEILLLTAKDNTFECTRCNSPNSRFLGFDITEYDKEIVRHSSCLKCGKDNSTVYKA